MTTTTESVWLITGCTSGVGEEYIRQIIARGDKVIGAGRNAIKRCQTLVEVGAKVIDLDLDWSDEQIQNTIHEAEAIYGHIDILVNNAGFATIDAFEELDIARLAGSFQANVFGTMSVTQAVFSAMRERGSGKVATIGSMAGWEGGLGYTPYSATKAALEGFTEVLRQEGALFGIQATIFELGAFDTGIVSKSTAARTKRNPVYDEIHRQGDEFVANFVASGSTQLAVTRMVEVLTGTGMAAGKTLPLRMPVGRDSMSVIKKKCEETIKICEEFEEIITSTDKQGVNGSAAWF